MDYLKLIKEGVQNFYIDLNWKSVTIDKLLKDPFLDFE